MRPDRDVSPEVQEFERRERVDEDVAAESYDANYHEAPLHRHWSEEFAALVASVYRAGDRVLDLGCGPGSLWEHWRRLPGIETLVGTDLSPRMLEKARLRFPGDAFVLGRAHDLPFPSGSFDVVIASSVLHHIPDQHLQGALAEIERVLDEHGTLVGREPSARVFGQRPAWISGALMHFRHLVLRRTRTRQQPEPSLGGHHHAYEPDDLLAALRARFTITASETRFPFSYYVVQVRSDVIARLAVDLDRRLRDRDGVMLHYVARKSWSTADDVRHAVEMAREHELPPLSDAEFLAYLQVAAERVEQLFEHQDAGA